MLVERPQGSIDHCLIVTTNPLQETTQYSYDTVGNQTLVTDKNGLKTTASIDPADRLTTTDALGRITRADGNPFERCSGEQHKLLKMP